MPIELINTPGISDASSNDIYDVNNTITSQFLSGSSLIKDNTIDGGDGSDKSSPIVFSSNNSIINGENGNNVWSQLSIIDNTLDASQSSGVSITADLEAQTVFFNDVTVSETQTINVVNIANVIGTNEADSIKGDSQNNQLTGLAGDDLIDGRSGNDVIDGGLGNDTLIGGAGDDTFIGSSGNDSINGGDGLDTVDYSKLGQAITLSGVGTIIKTGGFGTDQVFQVETVIADPTVANNTIDASQSLAGVSATVNLETQTISANNVSGLGTLTYKVINFDDFSGTNEADSITGDSQNNLLVGNAGNDTIIGGLGNDVLTGGLGADNFTFNSANEGVDIIKDYNFVEGDVIQVSKLGFGTTNSSDFTYNASTGNLSFLGTQLAFVENLSSNVNIQLV
ncbi:MULTISPECIES: calcium-binding protein [unclassified Nostoc]|uniref:calcium-binding protein n=1 Tax=unclassified Nostoc TaxID=2593658 RepID=UPI002AD22AAF|nr:MULTISPECIES: calcium-binding protein [unclassified Nostoc]MDZ8121768.1 calcium-binding protein [Nostoc sp. CmiVER01]MDZ8226030.1 calcium-binding protein [Nostoc sp. ChiVER01]